MEEPMKILIAHDGSDSADAALDNLSAAGLPAHVHALVMSLADVFVPAPIDEKIDDTFPLYVPEGIKLAHARARHALAEAEEIARQARDRIKLNFPTWEVTYKADADSPAWALIREADGWKPDLVVMGARGRSVFGGRLILGSISQRVHYEVRC